MSRVPHITTSRCVGRIDPEDELVFSVVVKETFTVNGQCLEPAEEPEPICVAPQTRQVSEDRPPMTIRQPEVVPAKRAPDLVVLATARVHPARGERTVTLKVGTEADLTMRVWGDRVAERERGVWEFSDPEPWEETSLSWDLAYGGVDPGIGLSDAPSAGELLAAADWHPGAYPRNDLGAGYITAAHGFRPEAIELPRLEWPDDLLTPDRLICPRPDRWHRQPRPAGFGWMEREWFPRSVFLGVVMGPWPDQRVGAIPEETLGLVPAGITETMEPLDLERLTHPSFYQQAAPGLTLPGLEGVDVIALEGLDNRKQTIVQIPRGRPTVGVPLPGGGSLTPDLQLLTLLLDLDAGVALRLWAAPVPLAVLEEKGIEDAEVLMNLDVEIGYRG